MKKTILKIFIVATFIAIAIVNLQPSISGNTNSLTLQNIVALTDANAESYGENCGDKCETCKCLANETSSGQTYLHAYTN